MTLRWLSGVGMALAIGLAIVAAAADEPVPSPGAAAEATTPPVPHEPTTPPIVPAGAPDTVPVNAIAGPPLAGKAGSVRFPDGSERPALNGVTEALEIPWPAGHAFSPIVEQIVHNGADWYRHADGTFTTTIVRTETVSGNVLQIPLCFTPKLGPAQPKLRQ